MDGLSWSGVHRLAPPLRFLPEWTEAVAKYDSGAAAAFRLPAKLNDTENVCFIWFIFIVIFISLAKFDFGLAVS